MPHGGTGVDPGDGVGRLALGNVRLTRLRVDGYGLVVLREVVVVLEPDPIELKIFRLDLALVVSATVQAQRLVHQQRAVHRRHEELLRRRQTLVRRYPDVQRDPENNKSEV